MKKFLYVLLAFIVLSIAGYLTFVYNVTYSEGVRSGQLIKFSSKGIVFKTWEGEISQGISGAQIFSFSVLDKNQKVISDLQELEGQYVKLSYVERYKTFAWWGDTKYFIVDVKKEDSPYRFK
tara:strand:- start:61 stop:426 length:366 start_codon:yes stop_codon:yes gene_type:complete